MKEFITIKDILHANENGVSRISAEVAGELLWFESGDIELIPAAEGFASAMLVPALRQKRNMVIEAAVDERWLLNIYGAMKQFRKWWRYPRISILATPRKSSSSEKGHKTALCFSGGVDSFYSLLCCGHRIDYLVFIHGCDISLKDADRLDAYLPSLKAIAKETGTRLIIIRTNIREHNFFRSVSWMRSFGGGLAAISHFMADIGKFIISASYSFEYLPDCGSHWKTDPLFSSSRVDIIHEGALASRIQKIYNISEHLMVRKYLRVCWEQRNELINCCQCEKCMRTMLSLKQLKRLDCFAAFPVKNNLLQHVEQLPYLEKHLVPIYHGLFVCKGGLEPALEKALYALLKRSHKGLGGALQYQMNRIIGHYKKKKNAFIFP
jgi:hypothetical protein